jgi:hypothetical protein
LDDGAPKIRPEFEAVSKTQIESSFLELSEHPGDDPEKNPRGAKRVNLKLVKAFDFNAD